MESFMRVNNIQNYSEQIVKRKMPPSTKGALVIGLMTIVFVIFISVYLSGFFGWLIPVALLMLGLGIYLIYYLIKNSGVEYEYTFVMGEMRIDKIKGKSKRKRMITFDVKSVDVLDKYIDPETGKKNVDLSKYDTVVKAAVYETNPDTYYTIIHDKKKQLPAVLLFTPDDNTLGMIQPYLPVELKKKFFMEMKKRNAEKKTATEDNKEE